MGTTATIQTETERAIRRLLSRHTGDGGVYVPRATPEREAFRAARVGGFVNEDGFLTRKGRHLLAGATF